MTTLCDHLGGSCACATASFYIIPVCLLHVEGIIDATLIAQGRNARVTISIVTHSSSCLEGIFHGSFLPGGGGGGIMQLQPTTVGG